MNDATRRHQRSCKPFSDDGHDAFIGPAVNARRGVTAAAARALWTEDTTVNELRMTTPDGVFELIVRGDPAACATVEESNQSFRALVAILRLMADRFEQNAAFGDTPISERVQ